MQHGFQHRNQMPLGNGLGAAHHLPLRDGVDGVDVVHAGVSIGVALMHRIDPEITRLAARIRFAPLGDGDLARLGVVDRHALVAIAQRVSQVVQVGNRNAC